MLAQFLSTLLDNDWFINVFALAVAATVGFVVWSAGRAPLWAEAYRRLGRNKLAMVSLTVILLFAAVALTDSIGWRADANAPRLSLLDRAFLNVPQEPTYSAPLATTTMGEPKPRALKGRHLLGTDGIGQDVLYRTLKGSRTAFIIGGFTLLLTIPVALAFGLIAGYFGKRVDDAVQYTYTVLDSIPGILLLVVLLMVLGRGLPQLCVAQSVTAWVGLCRLTRGETLKHRDREYVRAARALGVSHSRIMLRHILPNMLPLVIISTVLGFSGLVLSEAVLSYLGLGLDASTGSWGNMIDAARIELARDPLIWWNLAGASGALFLLVLAFNLFGDALRDAIDPRLRS